MRRFLIKGAAAIAALAVLAAAASYWYLRRSLPVVDGVATVAGLSRAVEIVRDADDVPHIFGATRHDALFGLGYVHAQDRLWQMEFQRRVGFGRLSEVLGPAAIPQDRFLRTIGFGRAARAAWAHLPAWARRDVGAYVAGVNAFIAAHHGRALPPEFTLLRFEPEPWDGPDVVVWAKLIAWDLSGNYSYELLRHDLLARVGPERMAQLMPPTADDALSILSREDLRAWLGPAASGAAARILPASRPAGTAPGAAYSFAAALSSGPPPVADFLLGPTRSEGLGSNSWVVDGTRTASGRPLLANDPHLAARVPSVWYLAHVSAGDFDVIGATFPGTPVVAIGRNRAIAWGATNVGADVEDLYRETLDPSGRFAEFRGALEPLTIVPETIEVKGREPIRLDVRISRHGPLVSDAINATNAESTRTPRPPPLEPLAFRWTALDPDDTTVASLLRVNEARSWADFTAAFRDFFVVPSQNFVYADAAGHIGYIAPGRIPIRARGDGTVPADGASGDAEWIGWVPFDRLPHAYDPPSHAIVTANNRPAPPPYPYLLGVEWPEPYRAQRIADLLGGSEGAAFHADDFAAMQADRLSLHARALLPPLLARARPLGAADTQALALLRAWNAEMRPDSAAAAIFQAWFLHLAPTIAGDELGPLVTESYQGRFTFITRFVLNVLSDAPGGLGRRSAEREGDWCDDRRTPARETCDDAVSAALHLAVVDLTRRMGGDLTRWRWDRVHVAVFPHQGLDAVAALRPFFSRSLPSAGDWSTVDVGATAADHPFEQRNIVSYRQIIDLSPQNDSRFIDAIGQSGHPLSPHYADFLPDWTAVRLRRMRMDRADIERGAVGRLRLQP